MVKKLSLVLLASQSVGIFCMQRLSRLETTVLKRSGKRMIQQNFKRNFHPSYLLFARNRKRRTKKKFSIFSPEFRGACKKSSIKTSNGLKKITESFSKDRITIFGERIFSKEKRVRMNGLKKRLLLFALPVQMLALPSYFLEPGYAGCYVFVVLIVGNASLVCSFLDYPLNSKVKPAEEEIHRWIKNTGNWLKKNNPNSDLTAKCCASHLEYLTRAKKQLCSLENLIGPSFIEIKAKKELEIQKLEEKLKQWMKKEKK